MGRVIGIVFALLTGLALGAVGTAIHRSIIRDWPLGLLLALALTVTVALAMRAGGGGFALLAFGLGWTAAVQLMSLVSLGGDVLVLDPSAAIPYSYASLIWSYLGMVLIALTALLPRSWFAGFRTNRTDRPDTFTQS